MQAFFCDEDYQEYLSLLDRGPNLGLPGLTTPTTTAFFQHGWHGPACRQAGSTDVTATANGNGISFYHKGHKERKERKERQRRRFCYGYDNGLSHGWHG